MSDIKQNKAVARAIDILDYISKQKKPVTLATLNKELGIPKSSVFDITHTLVSKNMLSFNEESKSYLLGLKSFEIGNSYLSGNDVHSLAIPYLHNISRETGETAFLAAENDGMIVYLDKVEGKSPTRTTCSIGDRNLMYCTGLGKAILATHSLEDIRYITGGGALLLRTPNTLKTFHDLIKELEETRKRGYSIDNREDNEFIFCIGCPVLDSTGRCVAAISVSCIYTPSIEEHLEFYSSLISKSALEISRKLGYLGSRLFPQESYKLS